MLARDEKLDEWSYPAFYTLGGLTFGLQIGGAVDEVVLMAITLKGLDAMLTSLFKLGLAASVALGPVGAGLKGATADILAFSRSKGWVSLPLRFTKSNSRQLRRPEPPLERTSGSCLM